MVAKAWLISYTKFGPWTGKFCQSVLLQAHPWKTKISKSTMNGYTTLFKDRWLPQVSNHYAYVILWPSVLQRNEIQSAKIAVMGTSYIESLSSYNKKMRHQNKVPKLPEQVLHKPAEIKPREKRTQSFKLQRPGTEGLRLQTMHLNITMLTELISYKSHRIRAKRTNLWEMSIIVSQYFCKAEEGGNSMTWT